MTADRALDDATSRSSVLPGVQLGLGLTQLGRQWGYRAAPVPTDAAATELLTFATGSGVRVFDTAPSYGSSEERLGRWLRTLSPARRSMLIIMTKAGEQWDQSLGQSVVDHRYDALAASIERSLDRLGRIDVLQLHRANADALRCNDVRRATERALSLGIAEVGASVSDLEAARAAIDALGASVLQFPYNRDSTAMAPAFELAAVARCSVMVNRPLAMGKLAYGDGQPVHAADGNAIMAAYRFVLGRRFHGAVLTGTSSTTHLAEDIQCFARAQAVRGSPAGER